MPEASGAGKSAAPAVPRDPLLLQRNLILVLLIVLAAAAWWFLWWQGSNMDMAATMSATMGMAAPLFLAVWVVMMVAMMFPTAAPMILTFHRVQAVKQERGGPFVPTWIFVAGYMVVWSAAGIVAYAAAVAGEWVAIEAGLSPAATARIGAVLLILAGIYQLTPLKRVCLAHCQTPAGFIVSSWRDGAAGALQMGLLHGLYCLGCCWLLFVILFPLGMMNIAAMALITVLIFAEKTIPGGQRFAQAAAVLLIAYGIAVLVEPAILPTFMDMARPGS
jgi:predicted metal-binding membrane protein